MIPYYSPNFGIVSFLKSLFIAKPKQKLLNEFREITGKKHILITNSCRSALYLTYKSLGKTGEVITTPLTCKVAIDPIIAGGNRPVFSDVEVNSLLIDPDAIEEKINDNTLGIQIIHLGGFCCDVDKIEKIARRNDLFIVEDCAQALFSSYKGKPAGRTGDVVCFSLIKNAYGIGGGILATDDDNIFNKSCELQDKMDAPSRKLITFRIVRNMIETNRSTIVGEKIYQKFMAVRGKVKPTTENKDNIAELKLRKPSLMEIRIAAVQFNKAKKLNEKRKVKGKQLLKSLIDNKLTSNYSDIENFDSAFVKYYIYNKTLNSKKDIPSLNKSGIEAKHLEHSFDNQVQERIANKQQLMQFDLNNYDQIHDSLISLPLTEKMTKDQIRFIEKAIQAL